MDNSANGTELDASEFESLYGYSASIWMQDPQYRKSLIGKRFTFNGRELAITKVELVNGTAEIETEIIK